MAITGTVLDADGLRAAMRIRRLSAFRLAVAAGVDTRTIQNALSGRAVLPSTYAAIIRALEATPTPPAVAPIPVGASAPPS